MTNLVNKKIADAQRAIAGFISLIVGQKSTIEWGYLASCSETGRVRLPRPKTGDADEIALMTRMAVHETGHKKYTNFDSFESLDGNVQALFNALEDPRIEREQVKEFPGAGLILNRGLADTLREVDAKLDPEVPADRATLVAVNVVLKGYRKLVAHEAMKSGADNLVGKGDKVLGDAGVSAVEKAIEGLVGCKSTADVIALAKELWVALQPPEPEQQGEPQSQPDQQASEDDGEGDQEPTSKPDEATQEVAQKQEGQSEGDGTDQADASQSEDSQGESVTPGAGQPEGEPSGEQKADGQGGDPTDAGGEDAAPQNGTAGEGEPDDSKDAGGGDSSGNAGRSGGGDEPQNGEGQQTQAHNQQPQGGEEGGNTQTPSNNADGESTPRQNVKLDLTSAMGTDLGSMLAQAYEQKYGKPDLNVSGQPGESTVPDDDLIQVVAKSLEQAAYDGESLEKALELIEVALQEEVAAGQASDSDEELPNPVLATGGGNATGAANPIDTSSRLSGVVSRLVRVFTKELQDKRRRTVKLASAGGQVSASRLWRLKALGDTNVFKVTTSVCGIDAAATILLDRSGSMHRNIVEAATAALSCSQALERISKVKTSIEMFPGYAGAVGNTVTLQAFGQSARQVARRVSEVNAEGGTPLAEALQEVLPRLLKQRVKKRIVFLITDGIPNNLAWALSEIEKAEKMGVEFVGIGIGDYGVAIEGLTPFSVCINDVSELPDAFEKLFRGKIALKMAA